MKKWVFTAVALALAMPLLPVASMAAELSGRLTTALEYFDNADEDTAVPAYLYGYGSVTRIADDPGFTFRGYGRLAKDLAGEVDRDSRLYYAYLEKRDLLDGLDVKLGRQFVATTAGASTIDGVDANYELAKLLKLRAFVGGAVSFDDDYEHGDYALGAEIGAHHNRDFEANLSYYQEYDDGDLAFELFGLDARYDVLRMVELTGELQYNYLRDEISYIFAEADYHRSARYGVRVHYLYDVPLFKSTSIYSVFAVDQYEEAQAEFTYNFGDGYRALARYTIEFYEKDDDASVYEAGVDKLSTGRWYGYALGTWRIDPDGQGLYGVKLLYGDRHYRYFQPGVGVHLDVLERRREDNSDDETTSSRVWIFARSDLTDTVSLEAKLERSESDLYDQYYSGRIKATYRF